MVKAVRHTANDTVEEAAYGALKGGLIGAVASFAAGAAITVAGVALLASVGGAIAGAFSLGSAAAATGYMFGVGGGFTAALALAGGIFSGATAGTVSMAGGALLGSMGGHRKANREHSAYVAKMQNQNQSLNQQAQMVENYNSGAQMGVQAGIQQGRAIERQEMVAQLQQAHAQLEAQEVAMRKFTDMHKSKAGKGLAEMVEADKAASASAGLAV